MELKLKGNFLSVKLSSEITNSNIDFNISGTSISILSTDTINRNKSGLDQK